MVLFFYNIRWFYDKILLGSDIPLGHNFVIFRGGGCDEKFHTIVSSWSILYHQNRGNIFSCFSSDSEAFASEIFEEMYFIHSDRYSMSKSSTTPLQKGFIDWRHKTTGMVITLWLKTPLKSNLVPYEKKFITILYSSH